MKLFRFEAVSIHEIHMHSNIWMRNKKFHPHVFVIHGDSCATTCSGAGEQTLEEKARCICKASCLHTVPGLLRGASSSLCLEGLDVASEQQRAVWGCSFILGPL